MTGRPGRHAQRIMWLESVVTADGQKAQSKTVDMPGTWEHVLVVWRALSVSSANVELPNPHWSLLRPRQESFASILQHPTRSLRHDGAGFADDVHDDPKGVTQRTREKRQEDIPIAGVTRE